MELTTRPFTAEELDRAWAVLEQAFGNVPHPQDREIEFALVDPDRTLGAFAGTDLIGTAASFAMTMTVPGGQREIGFVTWVGVTPTHRRRGVLTTVMTAQLQDLYERGESVTALWASEGKIYPRFGYGLASGRYDLAVPRGAAFARPVPPGRLTLVPPTAAGCAGAYDEVAARTPGWTVRDDAWWNYRLHDPEHRRRGNGPLQCVIDDETGSYALYAVKSDWAGDGPAGIVTVQELVATHPAATARLWRYLLDLDLTAKVVHQFGTLDDPLLQLLSEPRTANATWRDGLWCRLVDVGAALPSRSLDAEVDVVLEVTDRTCPWNARRWRLAGDLTGAVCSPTTDPAELRLDVEDLGAAFLGGTSLLSRAAAGRVEPVRPGALVALSRALAWTGPPASCPMIF